MIYTDNWAFLHIPKNAGINFRNRVPKELVRGENYIPMQFIADNLQNSIISEPHPLGTFPSYGRWWHNPISYQLKHIPQLNKLPWITIIRHPADRLVSWFHFNSFIGCVYIISGLQTFCTSLLIRFRAST